MTEDTIRIEATSRAVYDRGQQLYQNEAVGNINIIEEGSILTLRGYVEGSNGRDYYNLIEVDKQKNQILYYECECPAAYQYEGACKHTVAMLLKFKQKISRGEIVVHNLDVDCGDKLLAYYESMLINEEKSFEQLALSVTPKLVELREGIYGLSLTIGDRQSYVIKDINDFVLALLEGTERTYGKHLTFKHHINCFQKEDRRLIELLINEYMGRERVLESVVGGKVYQIDKRSMTLTPNGLDTLFNLYRGKWIDYQDDRGSMTIQCLAEDPPFVLRVEEAEGYLKVYPTSKHYQLIETGNEAYILKENKWYRISEQFKESVMPLLRYMQEIYPPQVTFDQQGFERFMTHITPRIKKQVALQLPIHLEGNYTKPTLSIKIYLDKDYKHHIRADVVFNYEGIHFNPYQAEVPHIGIRLIEEETLFNHRIRSYGFELNEEQLILEEEQAVYRFLTEGIKTLMEHYEVHVTNQLKDIQMLGSPIGHIGMKLKSNLLKIDLKDLTVPVEDVQGILNAYKTRRKYYRLSNGNFIDLIEETMDTFIEMADILELKEADFERGEKEVHQFRAIYLSNLLGQSQTIKLTKDAPTNDLLKRLEADDEQSIKLPDGLEATLRAYQIRGYGWLKLLSDYGLGGILADDMGLGKTLQIITLLLKYKEETTDSMPSLVIVPTSLILNWKKEIEQFAPTLKVLLISGDAKKRALLLEGITAYDVIITSYELLKRDQILYTKHTFAYCIADEAQAIKNPHTQNAKSVKSIQANVRFALTGTPIENNLSELWSLFDFCMPGYLYSYHQFKASFESPIMRVENTRIQKKLGELITPFMLRRLKKDVLTELPSKTETILYNRMENKQRKVYDAHLALVQEELEQELELYGFEKSHVKILAMLTRLRQICCDPSLFLEDYDGQSGKLNQCMELIEERVMMGHKIIIFSQFTKMLGKIAKELDERKCDYYTLTGQTKAEERIALVEAFNQNHIPVFLISLKAGGVGLNITGADTVIHYDPWWNVSSENQGTDRVYRIGQDKCVQVFKLITEETIEEKIKLLQDKKIHLAEVLLGANETLISKLTEEEIIQLFKV